MAIHRVFVTAVSETIDASTTVGGPAFASAGLPHRCEEMHMETGWLPEEPAGPPPMPWTEMALARQRHRAGPLEVALARSAADDRRAAIEAAANAPDPDERAAGFVARGYSPSLLNDLAQ